MKNNLLNKLLSLTLLIMGGAFLNPAWGETATLTNAEIVASGDPTSGYSTYSITGGGGKTWNTYAIRNFHSKATNDKYYLQLKKYASSTASYIQIPVYGTKITSITMTVSSTSQPMTGGGNSATLYFSASNSTSSTGTGVASSTGAKSVTIDCSSLNLNTGYITTSAGVRIWDVEVTYSTTSQSSAPTIDDGAAASEFTFSKDVTITATEGATIYYTTDGTDPTKNSSTYSSPIHITKTTTIKAAALEEGKELSSVSSKTFTKVLADNTITVTGGTTHNIALTGAEAVEEYTLSATATNGTVSFALKSATNLTEGTDFDFENGEAADYWQKGVGYLVTPDFEGTTGQAASIKSGSDRGDYILTEANYAGVGDYNVDLDFAICKGSKTAFFAVMSESSWIFDYTWNNWGYFWKTTTTSDGQVHNPYLFELTIPSGTTAYVNEQYDAQETGLANVNGGTWDFTEKNWYHLNLKVKADNKTVGYTVTDKATGAQALSGTYTMRDGESIYMKGIYERNNRMNADPGSILFDNIVVSTGSGPVTAIETVNAETAVRFAEGVYNLRGQKVGDSLQGLKKGLYIVNGKKVSVK